MSDLSRRFVAWGPDEARSRNLRRAAQLASLGILIWAIVELISLAGRHTTGAELYGVLVAALAVVAAGLDVGLLATPRRRAWLAAGALVVWALVALGGVAGVAAHVVGPDPAHGQADPRPRPFIAPLVFTAMGAAGGLTTVMGYRSGNARVRKSGEEQ